MKKEYTIIIQENWHDFEKLDRALHLIDTNIIPIDKDYGIIASNGEFNTLYFFGTYAKMVRNFNIFKKLGFNVVKFNWNVEV